MQISILHHPSLLENAPGQPQRHDALHSKAPSTASLADLRGNIPSPEPGVHLQKTIISQGRDGGEKLRENFQKRDVFASRDFTQHTSLACNPTQLKPDSPTVAQCTNSHQHISSTPTEHK